MKKRILKWTGRAGVALIVLMAVIAGALATSPGQRMVLGLAGYFASNADSKVEIGRLEGSLFGTGSIDRIALSDRKGTWLDVRDVRFAWRPGQLLFGHFAVDRLAIASVHMLRGPDEGAKTPSDDKNSAPTLLPLTVKLLEVSQVILDEPVVGRAVVLRATASADLADPQRGLAADLAVQRLDGPGGQLEAHFAYRAQRDEVDVRVEGGEPADGLIAHVLEFPNRPPLAVTFTGSGPRDRWRGEWALMASDNPFAAGSVAVDRVEHGRRFETRFEGYLGHVVPAVLAGVVDGKTVGALSGVWSGQDRVDVHELSVASDAMQLSASGGFDVSRNAARGSAALRLGRKDGAPVRFRLASDEVMTIDSVAVDLSLPDTLARVARADIDVRGIKAPFGAARSFRLSATAEQRHAAGTAALDAEKIEVSALLDGLQPPDGVPKDGEGAAVRLEMSANAAAGTLTIASLTAEAEGSTLSAKGTLEGGRFAGTAELQAADLSRFSDLASLPLAGALVVRAEGDVGLSGQGFVLDVEAAGRDLNPGTEIVGRLLAGTARLQGRVEQSRDGDFEIDDLVLKTDALDARVAARASDRSIALDGRVEFGDLSKVSDALAGGAMLTIDVSGARDDVASRLVLKGQNLLVHGAKLASPALSFSGRGPIDAHRGRFELTGELDGQPMTGSGAIAYGGDEGIQIDQLNVRVASAQIDGSVRVPPDGTPGGRMTIAVPRFADLAPLAGVPLGGSARAEVAFSEESGVPVVVVQADAPSLRFDAMKLQGVSAQARITDYVRSLRMSAKVRLSALDSAQLKVRDLQVDATPGDQGTSFTATAGVNEFRAALNGDFSQKDALYVVGVSSASLRKEGLTAVIDQRAVVSIDKGVAKIGGLVIKTEGGRTEVGGTAGPEKIDIAVVIKRLPADLANAFDRTLGLEGHIDGTIKVRGTTGAPEADAVLSWGGASAQVMRAQSLPSLQIDASARLADNKVSGEVTAGGVDGLAIKATARAGLTEKSSLGAHIEGKIPLSLANGVLGERAASADGTAHVAADVSGKLAAPKVAGTIRIDRASLNDPASGLKLVNVAGTARFTQDGVVVDNLQGASARGGTFSSKGRVARGDRGAMTTDVRLDVVGLKFDDKQMMSGELDANLAVRGPLEDLLVRGAIDLKRLDVIVPSQLPQSITSLDIKHVNAPANSRAARESAKAEEKSAPPVNGRLDVRINAANRIFVRGRGLDAQLGGGLHIRGTIEAPTADGAFVMERGRLTIVGRQLDFKRGRIFFNGSLEPQLDMEASADADGYTISVFIVGPASKPKFKFSSDPALPEDEAMARLLFNKSLAKLSPVQLAQLASEVDKIGGLSSGPSTLDRLKSAVGVDVLDVSTDDDAGPTVSAGSYVDENTYVGVRQGTSASSSRVVIDHDFTKTLKARGELGADGDSKIGVGVEWDY